MLSLLKKDSASSEQSHSAGWHPNFRNFTQLPDTKVVRTSFLFTGISATVALGLLVLFAYQEYNLYTINKQIDEWTAKVEQEQKPSQQAIALYKQFQEEQRKVSDVEDFIAAEKLQYTDFVIKLAEKLPRNVALTMIDYAVSGVTLRGVVKGEPDLASGIASAYEKQLRDDVELGKKFGSISITTLARDAQSGQLTFEIVMRFEAGGKKK